MHPALPWPQALGMLIAAVVGAMLALLVLPHWLPALLSDIAVQKAPWHLARSSGVVSYFLLWLSMVLGLSLSSRTARVWPGNFTAFDLHQFTSLLALTFAAFHAMILLGDAYIGYTPWQIVLPFAAAGYRPGATGLGQLAFYLTLLIIVSFYVRGRIGHRAWRWIHVGSFLMESLAREAGLRIITELPAHLLPVRMDEGSCEIILRNLLDNAIKYTPAGGEVRVQARVVDQSVELVVADTDIGVPEKDLPRIFDRFYRVDKARNRRGAGLGLALVRELVHQHGGDIRAYASLGQSLTMALRFPISPTHS